MEIKNKIIILIIAIIVFQSIGFICYFLFDMKNNIEIMMIGSIVFWLFVINSKKK